MKVSELRLGNLVIYEQTTHFITLVDRLDFIETRWLNQHIDESDYRCSIGTIKPIPITEEWLIKFRFKKRNDRLFTLNYFEIHMVNELLYFKSYKLIHLYFIHQLQNIYFISEGVELEL